MKLDERLVRTMVPGMWHEVDWLSAELRAEYADVVFGLERLKGYGFVCEDRTGSFSLTSVGVKLHDILESS